MKLPGTMNIGFSLVALLFIIGICAAMPMEDYPPDGSFIDHVFHSWMGFATNDKESHVLRMNIECVNLIDPSKIRTLLGSNASVEEIYAQIRKERREFKSEGYLRLGKAITVGECSYNDTDIHNFIIGTQRIYKLVNIKMKIFENYTVVDSDVSEQNNNAKVVGHITVNVSDLDPDKWTEMSMGHLTMSSGLFPGEYKVLLETRLRESTLSNESWGINLLDIGAIQDKVDIPLMNASKDKGSS